MPLGALAPDQGRAKNWQDVKPNKEVVKGNYYELLLIQMMGILWNDVGRSILCSISLNAQKRTFKLY
jgi:hypothetical protein